MSATPGWQMDSSMLLYGERDLARVVEPTVRITRLFGNGHRMSAQFGYDAITGASPTGALPSGQIQTTTTPSGNVSVTQAGDTPTTPFQDERYMFDASWEAPVSRTSLSTLGFHFSREKDYQSLGGTATMSFELMQRLLTVTAGAGYNHDAVFPTGGTREGMADSAAIVSQDWNPKNVTTGLLGVSRVLSRRWLFGVTGSVASEQGYLTEPYKVLSLVDQTTGDVTGQVTEKRPARRNRASVLASSVYHLSHEILYLNYRYYGDDWSVRSHTVDTRVRFEMGESKYLQPHLRYYAQTAASFYAAGLDAAAPLPSYASSDTRLGPLRTATIGLTYGFQVPGLPGRLSLRGEYVRQWLAQDGDRGEDEDEPEDEEEVEPRIPPGSVVNAASGAIRVDSPPVNIASLLFGYSISF